MIRERLFRQDEGAGAFDWRRAAREFAVDVETARALHDDATRVALADPRRAEVLYLRALHSVAGRAPAGSARAAGRMTRQVYEAIPGKYWTDEQLAAAGPGKWTRVQIEATRRESRLSGHDDVQQAMAALMGTARAESANADETRQPGALAPVGSHPPARDVPARATAATDEQVHGEPAAIAAPSPAALREQLQAAAAAGRGVAETLAAADPATAREALHQLRGDGTPVLRLITQAAAGKVERVVARGSSSDALPAEHATRLSPHVGPAAAGAARLHTDDAADLVAAAHHARAVTVGTDIYFARGEFAPGTTRGDELLAHELTHVAQGQRGELTRAAAKGIDSGGTLDPAEAEADLRARFAVIQLHAPAGAAPPLAQPSGQPTSDGARQAKLAAQQQRLGLAGQSAEPVPAPQSPPAAHAAAPVPHQPPAMKPAPHPAPAGNAYVDAFAAPPSKQATELWAKAGAKATTQAAADQARFDANLPPMPVQLDGGDARAGKAATRGSKQPARPPARGAPPPAVRPTPTPRAPAVTAGATAASRIQPVADKAEMQAAGQQILANLPTTAPDIKTDPGPAPVTDLAGQADPVRAIGDHQHAIGESARALDDAKTRVLTGPGAAQVQPAKLDEKLNVPREQATGAMPQLPTVEGMAKFKKWNLPGNAQASFDELARPKMEASLGQAKAKMTEATTRRDVDRSKAVTDAQTKVKTAHADADKQQQQKVAETRSQIANHQADTLVKHEAEIKKLDQQSGDKKKSTLGKINDRITTDQARVDTDYQAAQKKAEDKKKQGEEDARKKKEQAEKRKDHNFWEQAADVVCDGIQAIADEIDKALEAIGKAIGEILDAVKNAACQLIDAARDFVCQALTEFGDWLKSAVTALLGSVFPELAAALNRLIDAAVNLAKAAVNAIADGLKKAVTLLCDTLKGALDGIIAAFRAAVQAAATLAQALVRGDWAMVARMVLEGILRALGIDPAAFYALIGKAMDSIDKIIENPGAFVGHLVDAVKLGFKQFGAHFWTHLKDGLVQWLFGTFASAGIHMPGSFDLAGIFDLVCQVLGLTWPRLRGKVVKVIGEKNTERLEFVGKYLQTLVAGGFSGLWAQVREDMSGLWDMVVGGIRDWILEKVVQQAIIKIATMWNPAGAIIQLIETAWNVYQWVRENAQRIFGLVQAVVDSMANIVAGNIGGAANFIEASLARLVPIAISLFADLIGLGGIADKIKGIITKVQTKVDHAIDKLIERVLKMFKGKDGKGADHKDDDHKDSDTKDDAGEVPRSLVEPRPAAFVNTQRTLDDELASARPGQVIFQRAVDPRTATKQLLAEHPDARFDKASGQLTLPAISPDAISGATSLAALGARVAEETGVSKVTLDIDAQGIALRGHINPDVPITRKKEGQKKRGDHVFAHGMTKLPAELRDVATEVELIGSKTKVDSAIGVIGSNVSHAAFKLVVDKPPAVEGGSDPQSKAFGAALQTFRPTFRRFVEELAMLDLAVATGASAPERAAAALAARSALDTLRTSWIGLLDTVHDQECTPLLDKAERALEQAGLQILDELKAQFPTRLTATLTADRATNPNASSAGSATPDSKAEGK